MTRKFAFLCTIGVTLYVFVLPVQAQKLHLNIMAGLANYSGDLQSKSFTLQQSHPVISGGLSYEISDKFYLRTDGSITSLSADDKLSKTIFQLHRNLNFRSKIYEANLLLEYNILNPYEHKLIPYVFAGVGVFHFNPYTYDSLGKLVYLKYQGTEGQGLKEYPGTQLYSKIQMNIPFGAGVKLALSDNIRVGLEMGIRKLFTDYLDDVSGNYPDINLIRQYRGARAASLVFRGDELKSPLSYPGAGKPRGNPGVKDSYYFCLVRLSYRLPFEIFGQHNSGFKRARVDCPKVL